MSTVIAERPIEILAPCRSEPAANLSLKLAYSGLAALILIGLPLFLSLSPWPDVVHYDLCIRNVMQGGVAYQDVFDQNLPGMIWAQGLVRWLFGWSYVALRAVDFLIVSASVWILVRLSAAHPTAAARIWTVVACIAFYLSTSEWCHCQRDTWMLLPAAAGLWLRCRQAGRALAEHSPRRSAVSGSVLEGLCWGTAVWIKPMIVAPALACWAVSVCVLWRRPGAGYREMLADTAGLLLGGLLVGGLGIAWLVGTGAWPYFLETLGTWVSGYYAVRPPVPYRVVSALGCFAPWNLVHLLAVPLALRAILGAVTGRGETTRQDERTALHGAVYLGWLVQAYFLQHPFDYVRVPPLLLALTLLGASGSVLNRPVLRRIVVPLFLGLVLLMHPFRDGKRLSLWGDCWRASGSARLRDELAINTQPVRPCWVELERLAAELRRREVHDGELTCYTFASTPLYLELNLRPSTRFTALAPIAHFYPDKVGLLRRELDASPQRYVVSDAREEGLSPAQVSATPLGQPLALPPGFSARSGSLVPWAQPVVWREWPYLVHEVHPAR